MKRLVCCNISDRAESMVFILEGLIQTSFAFDNIQSSSPTSDVVSFVGFPDVRQATEPIVRAA